MYELRMLRYAGKMYLDKSRPRDSACLGSALLDSALLHARSLHEFLTAKPCRDGIVARDFLGPESDWKPQGFNFVKDCIVKINIFRCHISKSRLTVPYTWKDRLPKIVTDIEAAMRAFINALPGDEQGRWQVSTARRANPT